MLHAQAAILLDLLTLTIQYMMSPTHTWNGVNYSDAFNVMMTGIGFACLLFGSGLMIKLRNLKTRANHQIFQDKAFKV